jgi:tetratricopeptide (TPR) repeat protein
VTTYHFLHMLYYRAPNCDRPINPTEQAHCRDRNVSLLGALSPTNTNPQHRGWIANLVLVLGMGIISAGCSVGVQVGEAKANIPSTTNSPTPSTSQPLSNRTSVASTKNITADELVARGITKGKEGDHQGAISDFTKAIEIDPKNTDAYNNRGNARYALGDKPGAIADYSKAIEINPKYAAAYNNRGNARYALGDKPGAIADYNRAIKIDPKYALAYANRGNARYALGDKPGAIADYNRAIKIDPKYALAYYNRGVARSDLGDKPGAIADYSKAIEINPKYTDAYINRGNVRDDLGDKPGAIADYTKAIEVDPKYALAYNNRGFVYYDLEDIKAANNNWREAISIDPQEPEPYLALAVSLYARGDRSESFQLAAKAVQLNKKILDMQYLKKEGYWSDRILEDAKKFLNDPKMKEALR